MKKILMANLNEQIETTIAKRVEGVVFELFLNCSDNLLVNTRR